MKVVLIIGGIGILAWFILSSRATATAPASNNVMPGKWHGYPPATPNTTLAAPGTDQNNQGPSKALYLAPVKSLRYYQ